MNLPGNNTDGMHDSIGLKIGFTLCVAANADTWPEGSSNCGVSLGSPPLTQKCHIIKCCGRMPCTLARGGGVVFNCSVHKIAKPLKLRNCAHYLTMYSISTAFGDYLNDKISD